MSDVLSDRMERHMMTEAWGEDTPIIVQVLAAQSTEEANDGDAYMGDHSGSDSEPDLPGGVYAWCDVRKEWRRK